MGSSRKGKVYEFIEFICFKKTGCTSDEIKEKFKLRERKTDKILDYLNENGLIYKSGDMWYPYSVKDLVNWDEMKSKSEDYTIGKEDT